MSKPGSGARSRIVKAADVTMIEKPMNLGLEGLDAELDMLELVQDTPDARDAERRTLEALRAQIISEGRKEAKFITDAAKAESRKIVEQAVQEARERGAAITDEAYAKGYEEGVGDGRAEGLRLSEEAGEIFNEAQKTREATIKNLEPELVELIACVTEKLLKDRAAFKPETMLCLIRAGLDETEASGDIKVRVSQDDYDAVLENKDELQKSSGGAKLEIIRDLSLGKSDCIIETEYGYIDSSLGQQFEAIKENLFYIRDMKTAK